MKVTINIPGFFLYWLVGLEDIKDDDKELIGISRVAYLSKKDRAHVFLPAAKWHDAAYKSGASIQKEWLRWKVDLEFLNKMLEIAKDNQDLQRDAVILYLIVTKYGNDWWEGI